MTYTAAGTLDKTETLKRYAPMVTRMARHLVSKLPASVNVDDIIQAGMIGLLDASTRYESGHGAQFETFAAQRVRGAMLDELRQNDWMPRGVRRTQRKIEEAIRKLEQRIGRAATEIEIAKELKVSLEEYQELLSESKGGQLISFHDDDSDGDGQSYVENHVADAAADPLARLSDKRFKQALVAAIEELPEREKMLMGLYYEQDLNFREIAEVLGVTESRICQLHGQAVARLRAKVGHW
ncbi:RNA polymerase sigma factor FliA [Betaproteobacteria bacterium GR16-43]|nr:RNA polymerase sigma factor FliA [Betaproteobacteria bacterium GR16-43]